jgi:hypothetical protein
VSLQRKRKIKKGGKRRSSFLFTADFVFYIQNLIIVMAATSILKKQVKRFVDKASEKELRMIYSIFELSKEEDWWLLISKEHQAAIKDAIEEADTDQVIPHSEMVKKYSKWLKK